MRTLALLAALLLLALHGQAEPLGETADQVPEPEAQLPAQDEAEAATDDMAISFDGRVARAAAGPRGCCSCRHTLCKAGEHQPGHCYIGSTRYRLCCRG